MLALPLLTFTYSGGSLVTPDSPPAAALTGPLYEMPASIELTWTEYRIVMRALFNAEDELTRWGPRFDSLVAHVRKALAVLLHQVWPELGEIDDEGTVGP